MEPLFSSGALERLASSDTLVALDFDGTLAPIVDHPAAAAMRPGTRRLLAEVARLYPCAVISGRPEEDVLRHLGGVTVWYVVGNRALQAGESIDRCVRQVDSWRPAIKERLAGLAGVALEDKGVSLAIHYRHAVERERTRAAIVGAASLLAHVRVIPGKDVVNLLPDDGPDKGTAVDRVRRQIAARNVLYAGDDATDEPVFHLDGITGIRVGPAADTSARYFIRDQQEIDELLESLVDLRPRRTLPQEYAGHPAAIRNGR